MDATHGRFLIMGTAGHIDHGKTELIKALTGIDTDRLPEEKERGTSIDLGFAFMDLPGGGRLGIVDVPGHERFLKNMLSGASGIDFFLLAVAADDGLMPQTVEHAGVLDLLGIHRGVIAVTKTDLVDPSRVEAVTADIRSWLNKLPFEPTGLIPVSAVTGDGLPELREKLIETANGVPEPRYGPRFRLAVDRVFTIKGHGLVVTGSARDGLLSVGDTLEVLPPKWSAGVRGIEVHGRKVDTVRAGQRTALNLSGLDRKKIERGMDLVTPEALDPSGSIEARVRLLDAAAKPLPRISSCRLHLGTWEGLAKLRLLGIGELEPGGSALAQIRLDRPVAAARGDRFIIQSADSPRVIGGGRVLRTGGLRVSDRQEEHLKRLSQLDSDDLDQVMEVVFHDSEYHPLSAARAAMELNLSADEAEAIIGRLVAAKKIVRVASPDDRRPNLEPAWLHVDRRDRIEAKITECVRKFHHENPRQAGMRAESLLQTLGRQVPDPPLGPVLSDMLERGELKSSAGHFSLAEFQVPLSESERGLKERLESFFLERAYQPPSVDDLKQQFPASPASLERMAKLLEQEGSLVAVGVGIRLHRQKLDDLQGTVRRQIEKRGHLAVSELRELLKTSRKFAIVYLEYLDRVHFTRRLGDYRVLYKNP